MITRSKAGKKVVLAPKKLLCRNEVGRSLRVTLHRLHSEIKPSQLTTWGSQNHPSDINKENDGSFANGPQIDNAAEIEKFKKNSVAVENERQTEPKTPSTKTTAQKTLPKTITAQRAEESKEKSVAEERLTLSPCPSDYDSNEILKWLQSRRDVGLWIKCFRENCGKWRFNDAIHDPVDVPKMWYCDMQLDPRVAYCDYPQQVVPPHILEDLIENKYNAGSIVWARLDGYPWWPAMVDDCPFKFRYYELGRASATIPIKYNVTFFAKDRVECSWILDRYLKSYKRNPKKFFLKHKKMIYRNTSYKDLIEQACVIADEAQELSIYERLKRFSFVARSMSSQLNINKSTTGTHNKNSPVMLRSTGTIQKEVSGNNLKTSNKTTAQQTASTSGIFSQSSVESQKNIQEFSQVPSDNTRPESSILEERTAQQAASTSRIYSRTSVESQKGTQVASDNTRLKSKIVSFDGVSSERNSYKMHPQTSFENREDNERPSQVASNNANQRHDESSDKYKASISRICSQTSLGNRREIERPPLIVLDDKSSEIMNVSDAESPEVFFDFIFGPHNKSADTVKTSCGSNCGLPQRTNIETKEKTKKLPQDPSIINHTPRARKEIELLRIRPDGSSQNYIPPLDYDQSERGLFQCTLTSVHSKSNDIQLSQRTLSSVSSGTNDIQLSQCLQKPSDSSQSEMQIDDDEHSPNFRLLDALLMKIRPKQAIFTH